MYPSTHLHSNTTLRLCCTFSAIVATIEKQPRILHLHPCTPIQPLAPNAFVSAPPFFLLTCIGRPPAYDRLLPHSCLFAVFFLPLLPCLALE